MKRFHLALRAALALVGTLAMATVPAAAGGARRAPKQAPAAEADVRYDIACRIDPATSRLDAAATLELTAPPSDGLLVLHLAEALTIDRIESPGGDLLWQATEPPADGLQPVLVRLRRGADGPLPSLTIRYHGEVHQEVGDDPSAIGLTIGPEGAYLDPGSGFYPLVEDARSATFAVETTVPAGWEAVSEGRLAARRDTPEGLVVTRYEVSFPLDGLHVVAGPYRIVTGGDTVSIACYLYEEDLGLAETYIAASAAALARYSERLGPYPFDRFAVVESFFPAGYGMPGFTLLGQDVIRLPFIPQTSLPHEIAHSWWGNGVYVDPSGGNWCEGLTTFVADYAASEAQGEAAAMDYRRRTLADYTAYVNEGNRQSLADFMGRHDFATQAVGYGKALMVFYMLRARIGDAAFDEALRQVVRDHLFHPAGWSDLQAAFEAASGQDLGWFFDQWIQRDDVPFVQLVGAQTVPRGSEPWVYLRLYSHSTPYRLDLPVEVTCSDGTVARDVCDAEFGEHGRWAGSLRPPTPATIIRVDPAFEVMRRLHPEEVPPALRFAMGGLARFIVLPSGASEPLHAAYAALAQLLASRIGAQVVESRDVDLDLPPPGGLIVLGAPAENPVASLVLDAIPPEAGVRVTADSLSAPGATSNAPGALLVASARLATGDGAAIIVGRSPEAITAAARKISHYGRYSYVLFVDGTRQAAGDYAAGASPLEVRLGGTR